jgi:transcriptional regulator with XRE-family HTH domain
MEIDYTAIGKRIRKCRKQLNLTQQQLAELSDLSDTNISHIERGATKLSLPSLISIANALNTTTDYLLMDVINNSDIQFKKEFAELLKDCSQDEYNLLYNICKAALENGR